MKNLKNHVPIILISLLMIAMAVVIFLTTQKLKQTSPVAPNVPQVKPKAVTPACTLTFSIAHQCNQPCTADSQCSTGHCVTVTGGNMLCRNIQCSSSTTCTCAGTPTPTTTQIPTPTTTATVTPTSTATPTTAPSSTPTTTPENTSTPTTTRAPSTTPTNTSTPGPTTTVSPTLGSTATPTSSPLASAPNTSPVPKIPVAGAGPGTIGAIVIAVGTLLLLIGLAF